MTDDIPEPIESFVREKYTHVLDDYLELQAEVDQLREENDELRRRLTQLEEVVDPDPESKDYERMTKAEKVRALRKAVIRKALARSEGKANMTYDGVMALFGNHPSAGHTYNLMKAAAEMDGFNYENAGTQGNGQKRLTVNLSRVNDTGLVQSVNKTERSKAPA